MRYKFILWSLLVFLGASSSLAYAQKNFNPDTRYLRYGANKVRMDIYNPGGSNRPVVILIHGAAGIEGDRAERYRGFASDIRNSGMIAINVHYFQSQRESWIETFTKAIDYAVTIPNADSSRIGLVGYSLGGTIALLVASGDSRVTQLVVESGYLPQGFTKQDAAKLPPTYICAGTEDSAIKTLYQLQSWFIEMDKPIKTKVNQGHGHSVPMALFRQNWLDVVQYLEEAFGLRSQKKKGNIRIRM
jgi:dienelactone hydrolase